MAYPISFTWAEERGYIPNIIPPANWRRGIKGFYENKGVEKIEKAAERFSESTATITGRLEVDLRWSENMGLDGISIGTHGGIYLETNVDKDIWKEHNLSTKTSLIAIGILCNYYSELSKYIK